MRKGVWFVVVFMMIGLVRPAAAWDPKGHEQIADIAWSLLTTAEQKKIGLILNAGEPSFRPSNVNNLTSVRAAFRKAATFPDFIKSNTSTLYGSFITTLNRKFEPHIEDNLNDPERLKCKTFHYYDTPLDPSGTAHPVRASNADAALTYIRSQFRTLVQSGTDLKMQCFWLYWLEHDTGDLHQPLHCAENWAPPFITGDDGGNTYHIKDPDTGADMRLHAFWDGGIVRARNADTATRNHTVEQVTNIWKSDSTIQPAGTSASLLNHTTWIAEGADRARTLVYADILPNTRPDAPYMDQYTDTCRKMALLGGYRLANLLKSLLH